MNSRVLLSIWAFALSFSTTKISGQQCYDYNCVISKVEKMLRLPQKDYQAILDNLESAEEYQDSKPEQVRALRRKAFTAIEKEKEAAKNARDNAEQAQKELQKSLDKNKILISYFGFKQGRAWAYRDGKFAVIDSNGVQLTDFIYEEPQPFREDGWALVRKDTSMVFMYKDCKTFSRDFDWLYPTNEGTYKAKIGNRYTFVDSIGRPLKKWREFMELKSFADNLSPFFENGKWGFLRSDGSVPIPAIYQTVGGFANFGVSTYAVNGKWGLLDTSGHILANAEYDGINYFGNKGLAVAFKDGQAGLIDAKGQTVTPFEYDGFGYFSPNGFISCGKNKLNGIMNAQGKRITEIKYDFVGFYNSEGLAVCRQTIGKTTTFTVVDSTGKEVIPPKLYTIGFFDKFGIAPISFGEKWGYIHLLSEKAVTPMVYDFAYGFNKTGTAVVYKDGKAGCVDTSGRLVIPLQYDVLLEFGNFNLAGFKNNGKAGFLNSKGEVVIPAQFDAVSNFSENGLACVWIRGKFGFINLKGEFAIKPIFDNVMNPTLDPILADANANKGFMNDEIFVMSKTEIFLIDADGNMVVRKKKR